MKIVDLKKDMDAQFGKVGERFLQVDERFGQIDRRFQKVDERFEQIDRRFDRVDEEFKAVRAEIRSEGETTRRHFEMVAQQLVDDFKVGLDKVNAIGQKVVGLTASNTGEHVGFMHILDDHEVRITALEPKKKGRR